MTTLLLVRHGMCDPVGNSIAGRMPGVHLNECGRQQVALLAERLAPIRLDAIVSSPLERATETAQAIARCQEVAMSIDPRLLEIDYGAWTGKSFSELSADQLWHQFNACRSHIRVPQGEHILEVQRRMAALVEKVRARHPDGIVALVGHGDPLKSLLALYLGISIDTVTRVEIDPASVSVVAVDDNGARVMCINESGNPVERVK